MTQTQRILQALARGPVACTDFSLPDVIDGGPPVMRVAARIHQLKDRGYDITSTTAPNGTAVYQLTAAELPEAASPTSTNVQRDSEQLAVPLGEHGLGVPLFDVDGPVSPGMWDQAA